VQHRRLLGLQFLPRREKKAEEGQEEVQRRQAEALG